MKWARAKTIFIYIFIVVNIFLFAVYKLNSSSGKTTDIKNVITILEGFNITAGEKVFTSLPKKMKQAEVRNISSYEGFVKELMGEDVTTSEGVMNSGEKSLYVRKTVTEYKNENPSDRGFGGINKHNAPNKIMDYISSLGVNKKYLEAERIIQTEKSFGAELSYSLGGKEIFENRLNVSADSRGVISFVGPLFEISELDNESYYTLSCEAVLIDYLSYHGDEFKEKTELLSVNGGYFVSANESGVSFYAIPAYEFTFSDGKNIFLDAREKIEPEFKLLK